VKSLLLPPLSLFLLAAAGLLIGRRWRRFGRTIAALAAALLVGLSTPAASGWLMQSLQVYPPLDPARIPAGAGAIVVLGGDSRADAIEYGADTAGALSLERARYAAHLHRLSGRPILATGGIVRDDHAPVARQIADVLAHEFGVPVAWTEDRSANTYENAVYSARELRRRGIGSVILVTHAWHMRRAAGSFRAAGLDVVPAPTGFVGMPTPVPEDFLPNADALRTSAFAVHEWIGIAWYRLAGYMRSI
jgi:uncharacterized SAM-binding protein YcdF (DUF218 family)